MMTISPLNTYEAVRATGNTKTDEAQLRRTRDENGQLEEAVNDFVSILLSKVFKDMYESIPKSSLVEEGHGEKWFREMVLDEYAKKASRNTFKSLSSQIYREISQVKER